MVVSIDIKKVNNHLSILQNELKETSALIDMLSIMCQNGETSCTNLLRHVQNEDACIRRRISVLENMIVKLEDTKNLIGENLEESVRKLKEMEI